MSYVFLTLGFFIFLLAAKGFGVVGQVVEAMQQFRDGIAVMALPDLSDDAKERALQRAARRTAGLFLRILLACTAAAAAATACLLVGNSLGLYDVRDITAAVVNPMFLLLLLVLGIASFRLIR
jgi:hypothetical protein